MERRLEDLLVIQAWEQLAGTAADPDEVVELERTWKKHKARPVYRLSRQGAPAFRVIAKPCRRDEADRTRVIYRDILSRLPFRVPDLLGFVPCGRSDRVWLFLEDIEGAEYQPERAEHRRLSGTWLAKLHVEASRLPTPAVAARPYLYDISSAGIREHLESSRSLLEEARSARLDREHQGRSVLESLSRQCAQLDEDWEALRELCANVPRTLVHGDFCVSNMLVVDSAVDPSQTEPSGLEGHREAPELVVFDWQRSGWAVPAFDLTRFLGSWADPDLRAYLEVVGREWPQLDARTVFRLAYVGEIFRWIEALRWGLERLRDVPGRESTELLAIYEAWMSDIRAVAPWDDSHSSRRPPWRSAVPYGRPRRLAPGASVHS
jgi:thiamine kinase-like enzyme